MNLSSNSFWADMNFGTATGSLSNNVNYYNNKPKHHSIYFSKIVKEREGENIFEALYIFDNYISILELLVSENSKDKILIIEIGDNNIRM